jgi:hypothetical protein
VLGKEVFVALSCPLGWELHSKPSDEVKVTNGWFTTYLGARYYYFAFIEYDWIVAAGAQPMQGTCGRAHTFTASFTIEEGTEKSINLGVIANAGTEAIEISGGGQYTWSSSEVRGVSIEQTVSPEECWEFMAIPVVLKTKFGWGHVYYGKGFFQKIAQFLGWGVDDVHDEGEMYVRGGLMICKRWCCDGHSEHE